MNEQKIKIPIRFFTVTFLWSWILWGGVILIPFESVILTFSMKILGAFGPAFGAIYSKYTIEGKHSLKPFFKSFLSLRFGWKVWIAIFLVLGITAFIAWILPEFWGEDRLSMFLPNVLIFFPYLLIMIFFGGGQEEIGWRAYISPILENRHGLIVGGLILGIVWAVWHLPLWFMYGASQTYMNFFGFTLMTIGYSYFLSWVMEASGNRPMSGLVAHGAANAFVTIFPWIIMAEEAKQTRYWIYVTLILIVGIAIVALRTYQRQRIKN